MSEAEFACKMYESGQKVMISELLSPVAQFVPLPSELRYHRLDVLEFAEIPEYLRPRFFCLLLTNFQIRQSYAICEKLQISARLRQQRGGKGMQQ